MSTSEMPAPLPAIGAPVWLTVKEAAARARVSAKIIRRAVADGKLRGSPVNARGDLRFDPQWVDDWLRALATQGGPRR